jgi:predicted transcriptional regulator
MIIITIIVFLLIISNLSYIYSESEIPIWIKHDAEKLKKQNNLNENTLMHILEILAKQGIIKKTISSENHTFPIPERGKFTVIPLFGNVNEYRKSGLVSLEIVKPDHSKEILHTPLLETGSYSTICLVDNQFKKGTYYVYIDFEGKKTYLTYFYLTNSESVSNKVPAWFITVFEWLLENKITDQEFIYSIQFLINNKIVNIISNNTQTENFTVSVQGQQLIRRGTTQTITTHVTYGDMPIEGAKVILTIEDYGEDIIREFDGFSDKNGDFIYSWEIPKNVDDIEMLLAYISVTYGSSSTTKLFKFQVYCLPGELNCKVKGN